ncbi:MAG: c-type cytochrome [Haliscomenobacter sp.]|uniref:c-type cytochrome n=1 Tax=Haliscomenobacter sp. TaxID=2717303 RepID=UPI0029AAE7F8|nr:c-type cytochrome [Haliscomenobacter sp.]MDX2072258.1 c-type cytochrome [Haliscomenobacter sp.]
MRNLFFLLLLGSFLYACSAPDKSDQILVNADFKAIEVDLEDLFAAGQFPKDTLIIIEHDEFFKQKKRYKAYPLAPILKPLLAKVKDTSNLRVTFTCSDGYAPNMNLSKVLSHNAYLVVQDLDQAKLGNDWADSLVNKFRPFYLVWQDASEGDAGFAWPYGLVEIRIASFFHDFADAFPLHNPAAQKGFQLFQVHCMKCHSVNKIGGVMGPEFNYPKSITEYWKKEDMFNFMRNPQSYRYSAKMPAVGLSRGEFEEIYGYLVEMKDER